VYVTLPDGCIKRREKLFPDAKLETQKEAARWELEERDRILKEEKEKQKNLQTVTVSLTVQGWINDYLDDVKRQNMTEKTYYEKKMAFVRFAGHPGVEQKTSVSEIDRYLAKAHFDRLYDLGRSGDSVNRDRKNLGAAWSWGNNNIRDWPEGINPFRAIKKYPENPILRYVPPEDDFWKVTDYLEELSADGDPIHVQNFVMHMAFLHLAARRSEVFRIRLKDLDFEQGKVRLWTRKRARGKLEYDWIPITSELKRLLLNWLKIRMGIGIKSDYIFVVLDNTPYCSRYFGQPFKTRQHFMRKVCNRVKVAPFGFHAIRHFTASYLFQKGYPVIVIQQILRHKSPNTTTRYLRKLGLDAENVRSALEEIKRSDSAEIIPLKGKESK
jgi:integrase